jgi:hypothetical protein
LPTPPSPNTTNLYKVILPAIAATPGLPRWEIQGVFDQQDLVAVEVRKDFEPPGKKINKATVGI